MEILPQLFAIALMFGALGFALWFLRRRGLVRFALTGRSSRQSLLMDNVESLPLTAQHRVHLIKVAGRAIVVSSHSAGCTLLGNFPWEEADPAGRRKCA